MRALRAVVAAGLVASILSAAGCVSNEEPPGAIPPYKGVGAYEIHRSGAVVAHLWYDGVTVETWAVPPLAEMPGWMEGDEYALGLDFDRKDDWCGFVRSQGYLDHYDKVTFPSAGCW